MSFANSQGFKVTRTFSNRLVVNVTGSASTVNQAFHLTLGMYQHPTEHRSFYAPDVEPTVESGVPLVGIAGLSNFNPPRPMLKQASTTGVRSYTTGSGPGGQFLGSDMRAAYAPGVALDGSGQAVGLVELGPYNPQDVTSYFSAIGQPLQVPIYNVLLDVDGVCSGTVGIYEFVTMVRKSSTGIQQAISMACPTFPDSIVYEAYGSNSDALTAFAQAASDNIARTAEPVVRLGWHSGQRAGL